MRERLGRLRLPTHPLFHLGLLALTFLTTTFYGAVLFTPHGPLAQATKGFTFWKEGLSFSVPLLLILGAHEMGHFLTCRRYGLPATLPYFIPAPVGIGTFGAVIRIKAPIESKKALFDVGVAGPLAGFAVALPVLLYGLKRFVPLPLGAPVEPETVFFSYPPLVTLAQKLMLGFTYTSLEVHESPEFMAAWFGLLVTAFNLLPLSQLDGGHVLYAVLGPRQRRVAYWLFGGLLLLSVWWPGWLLWAAIVMILGIAHPPVADESVPLDFPRRALGALALLIFLGCFSPAPIRLGKSLLG